ncbi:4-oxalocrotonate tautomerase [Burkholderia sp. 22PA0106]|uniref:4-oxalocrotonate tautomerase n=2 Tax=unclassified Burkholderia TaxID=2613784 RepID=UPI0039C0A9A8
MQAATQPAASASPSPSPSDFSHSRRSVMPTFQIDLFEGRTVEQKRRFVEAITRVTCETLDCAPSSVDIILRDVKKENWATAGKLWSDSE